MIQVKSNLFQFNFKFTNICTLSLAELQYMGCRVYSVIGLAPSSETMHY